MLRLTGEGGDGAGDGGSVVEAPIESVVESSVMVESGSTVESVVESIVEAGSAVEAVVAESGSGLSDDGLGDGGSTAESGAPESELSAARNRD